MRPTDTREALLIAGIRELRDRGLTDFSMRRIAAACEISCAAPYRHFKSKEDFVLEIFRYINRQWYMEQNIILCEYDGNRERLVEMSVAFVRFLIQNPDYLALLVVRNDNFNREQNREKEGISTCVRSLINRYCVSSGLNEADKKRKTYTVRSLIYGAAIMIDGGELQDSEKTYDMIRQVINREFEIA